MKLNIDYVSDLHLTHYISKNESITKIDKLVQDKISMQVKGDILVVAGDIDEDINRVSELLYSCSKYYKKVIFVLGNHEYYIPVIKYIYTDPMAKEYNYNSMNKVYRLNEIFNNYPMQNDSRFILSELPKKEKIKKLHNDSISWYNNLPNNIDLIITHVPPFRNKSNSRGNNSCYYTEVKEYKSPVWIYGHDHKEEDIIINNTRFVSNPWGYDTKEFKIKTLTLTK